MKNFDIKIVLLSSALLFARLDAQIQMQETPAQREAAHANLEVTPDDLKLALAASDRWLMLLDQGNYGESWEEASNIFRYNLKKRNGLRPLQNCVSL